MPMTVKDRNKHLRIVAEILQVHLPQALGDQGLARDLLSVVGVTLRAAWEDAERSAEVWDKKHYHVKADRWRDEWAWAMGAANYAEGLAYRDQPITGEDLRKLGLLFKAEVELSSRRVIKDVARFRGAAAANRERQAREKSRTPRRSLV
jgi:hypothetical protein